MTGHAAKGKQSGANSGLGKAIGYMLRHWQALTLFLREPGATFG
jgi:hypothetical protein